MAKAGFLHAAAEAKVTVSEKRSIKVSTEQQPIPVSESIGRSTTYLVEVSNINQSLRILFSFVFGFAANYNEFGIFCLYMQTHRMQWNSAMVS